MPVAFYLSVERMINFAWTALYEENPAEGCYQS